MLCCIALLSDGECKVGKDGHVERNGTGTHHSGDGTCYSGQWEHDLMTGNGNHSNAVVGTNFSRF